MLVGLASIGVVNHAKDTSHKKLTATKQDGGPANPLIVGAPSAEQFTSSSEYRPDCQRKEDADLCAQLRIADAAEAQTLFSILGLGVLALTLGAALWAAREARRAAVAGEKNNQSFERASRRQLRAYVHVDKIEESSFDYGDYVVTTTVRNFGNTPAYDVYGGSLLDRVLREDLPSRAVLNDTDLSTQGTIGPGQEARFLFVIPAAQITPAMRDAVRDDRLTLTLVCAIKYVDAYGGEQRTDVKAMRGGKLVRKTGRSFFYTIDGNSAT